TGVTFTSMSADGNRVAFITDSTDLVTGFVDGNGAAADIFVRDLEAAVTTLVTVNATGTASGAGDPFSFRAALSADGTRVYFDSTATDLITGFDDGNAPAEPEVYVRDLDAATTTLVSVNATGTASGNAISVATFAVSADGNRIVFASAASDLAAPDTDNADGDLFVRDVDAATTTLVTVNATGTDSANGDAGGFPTISADGNRVAFVSSAPDLAAPDTDTDADIFVRNLNAATTTLVSVNAAGTDSGNDVSELHSISPDGTRVGFSSDASDLVATDTNGETDMFVASLADTIQFAAGSYTVDEDAGTATIGLVRTGAAEGPVTVDFTTTAGTATAGADFADTDITVTFLAGQTTAEVTIPILDDPDVEADETVALALLNAGGGAELGAPITATLTIVDVAGGGGASLTIAVEGGDPTFTIDGPVDDTVVVDPGEAVTLTDLPAGAYTITLVDPDDIVVDAIDCDPEELAVDLDDRAVTINVAPGVDTSCLFTISDDGDYEDYPGDDDFDFDTPFDNGDDTDPGTDTAAVNPPQSEPAVAGDQLGTAGTNPGPAADPANDGSLPTALDTLPRTGLAGGLTLAGTLLLTAGALATLLGRRRRTNQA
ncbi:MAG: Calx-beta domain-containing protein, partial [Acidimicrobiia bacterium]